MGFDCWSQVEFWRRADFLAKTACVLTLMFRLWLHGRMVSADVATHALRALPSIQALGQATDNVDLVPLSRGSGVNVSA